METIRIPRIMQEISKTNLFRGRSVGFVPTMGALHNGHLSLIRRARSENDIVVTSIFVNPIQFGRNEDFDKYPRDIKGDMEKLENEGIDIVFIPDIQSIYPEKFSTYVEVNGLSDKLCGKFRPGHFIGVCTVVCKLLNIVMPKRAYFGQKDFQQALIINRMVEDLNMDVDVIVCPTVREDDGLAMSSRNIYLSAEQRNAAVILYKTLVSASDMIKSGTSIASKIKRHMNEMLNSEPMITEIQYAGVYDPDNLNEIEEKKKKNLLAIAVKIGDVRLIDNMLVEL